jgi:hypothetical protein
LFIQEKSGIPDFHAMLKAFKIPEKIVLNVRLVNTYSKILIK